MIKLTSLIKFFVLSTSILLIVSDASSAIVNDVPLNMNSRNVHPTATIHNFAINLLTSLHKISISKNINLINTAETLIGIDRYYWANIPIYGKPFRYVFRDFKKYGIDNKNIPYKEAVISFNSLNKNDINDSYRVSVLFKLKEEQSCITPEETKKILGEPNKLYTFLGTMGMECSTGFRDSLRYNYKYANGRIKVKYSLKSINVEDYTVSEDVHQKMTKYINTYQNHRELCAYSILFTYRNK